jgi:hypothetical protein
VLQWLATGLEVVGAIDWPAKKSKNQNQQPNPDKNISSEQASGVEWVSLRNTGLEYDHE